MRKGECRVMLNADICIEEYYKNFEKFLEEIGKILLDDFGLRVTYDKEKRTVTLSEEISRT